MKRLEIILKISERCNIACDYCYYFENAEQSAYERPAKIGENVVEALVYRIREAFENREMESVQIDLHGGEPLMLGKRRFADLCEKIYSDLPREIVRICMQTNATLVDDDWASILSANSIHVGVSIDGPAHVHDIHRLDKFGRSTHNQTIQGIQCLRRHGIEPSVLVVALAGTDPVEIYDYLVRDLGITTMDFLLPDATYDDDLVTRDVGEYLCSLFDRWVSDESASINLRYMKSALSLFMGGPSFLGGFGPKHANALTVLADGQIDGDDFLRVCGDKVVALGKTVFQNSLREAIDEHVGRIQSSGVTSLPGGCVDCAYAKICNGGQATHRFSAERGFDNPSRYCESLKKFYFQVCTTLLSLGMPVAYLDETLRNGSRENVDPSSVFPDRFTRSALTSVSRMAI